MRPATFSRRIPARTKVARHPKAPPTADPMGTLSVKASGRPALAMATARPRRSGGLSEATTAVAVEPTDAGATGPAEHR